MNELALFAGAGGGILGGKLLGWRTVCAVEWDAYARDVLVARQNDGCLETFPIWDDVQTFDGRPWRGRVDVVSGGFPCQDISAAGKGAGIDGERSGMWAHMARIICEVGPRFVFVENSPMLTSRGLGRVLGDLAAMGYDARWGVLGAVDVGAPHKRERIWIVANAKSTGAWPNNGRIWPWISRTSGGKAAATTGGESIICDSASAGSPERTSEALGRSSEDPQPKRPDCEISNSDGLHEQRIEPGIAHPKERPEPSERSLGPQCDGDAWWQSEPDVGRMAHGVAARVDRLKAIGNGQVPAVAALAWRILSK